MTKTCTACGKEMALRSGAKGSFYGCTGYPECKNTANAEPGEVAVPVVKPFESEPKKGFEAHLSIEQVRSNAFDLAIKMNPNMTEQPLLDCAKKIEQYLLKGL